MFLILVPSLAIIVIYAINPSMSKPLREPLINASVAIYFLYALLYYILLVFDHLEPPSVEKGLQQGARNLINEYERAEDK
jgi:hypothetical protein